MKQFFGRIVAILGLIVSPGVVGADATWINTGTVLWSTNTPQIDALNVLNSGTIIYSEPVILELPYDFQDLLNFTNRGTMSGDIGWQFDQAFTDAPRLPMNIWANQDGGSIRANSGLLLSLNSATLSSPNMILVTATNIVNSGTLSVGNEGLLHLEGQSVNLSRGGIEVRGVDELANDPSFNSPLEPASTNGFFSDPGIDGQYWRVTNPSDTTSIPTYDTASFVQGSPASLIASVPRHTVTNRAGFIQTLSYRIGPVYPLGFEVPVNPTLVGITNIDGSTTNVLITTNWIRQAALVGVSDTNFQVNATFAPSPYISNRLYTASVVLTSGSTNVVSAGLETQSLYVQDFLASFTNTFVRQDFLTFPPYLYRPASYEVWRLPPNQYLAGAPFNTLVGGDFFWRSSFSNRFVALYDAAYSASIDFVGVRPVALPGLGVTNQPGRVEVIADTLDLTRARFKGQGLISIRANHLSASKGAVVDAPTLDYALGSTNGVLHLQNLSSDVSYRDRGDLFMWSALWTNFDGVVLTNYTFDTNTGIATANFLTNVVEYDFHIFVLDATGMSATQPVVTYDFAATGTNLIMDDNIALQNSMFLDTDDFTLNGRIRVPGTGFTDWVGTNSPHIKLFTNNGTINIANVLNLGGDITPRYALFQNRGTITAGSVELAADIVDDSGSINSQNGLSITADVAKLDGGQSVVGGDLRIAANDLKLHNKRLQVTGGVFLAATNSIADTGAGASNLITCSQGFFMQKKPVSGDLLGTAITSTAGKFASVISYWAGADLGPSAAGFHNNAALGRLSLVVGASAQHSFSGPVNDFGVLTPGKYAIYIDQLQLNGTLATDPNSALIVDPAFTIYFADLVDGQGNEIDIDTFEAGLAGTPLEGRVVWDPNFAGPASGVDVALEPDALGVSRTIQANRNLVDSLTIDSDGDGLVNGADPFPFEVVGLQARIVSQSPLTAVISWRAAAQTTYRLDFKTDLFQTSWNSVTVANPSTSSTVLSYTNVISGTGTNSAPAQQYFRVSYQP